MPFKADKHSTMNRDHDRPSARPLAVPVGGAVSSHDAIERSTWSKTNWRSAPSVTSSGCWGNREPVFQ